MSDLQVPLGSRPTSHGSCSFNLLRHAGWCLIGEADKIVAASHRRFAAVTPTTTGFGATVHAASGETVVLWVLPPGDSAVSSPALDVLVVSCHASKCAREDCDVEMTLVCSGRGCTCI
jgi:hypothetical protein